MKVLIVDDSSVIRQLVSRYLKKLDIEVLEEASDGLEAMEKFKTLLPDLVTMDITMPEMDGLACTQEMLKINPDTRIIIISALAGEGTVLKALELGALSFVVKPVTEDKMQRALDEAMADDEEDADG